jgi:hypothetical protein
MLKMESQDCSVIVPSGTHLAKSRIREHNIEPALCLLDPVKVALLLAI